MNSVNTKKSSSNNFIQNKKLLLIGLAIICSIILVVVYNMESLEPEINTNNIVTQTKDGLPTDFDPNNYLKLNPDLEKAAEKLPSDEAKIAFAKNHYLTNGKSEKRKY
ncbi:MAG: hypothetical protein Q8L85_01850 [Alphaproteobacteria bacterium]|nr:hypothetical protein [Alphaproteobacteria bacterium]